MHYSNPSVTGGQKHTQYCTLKTLLGFDFDGMQKTLSLEEEKRITVLTTLKGWVGLAAHKQGVGFKEFESVTTKL